MTTTSGLVIAARMGERRGRLFAQTGLPARNPFQKVSGREDLAQAWRRAYFSALGRLLTAPPAGERPR